MRRGLATQIRSDLWLLGAAHELRWDELRAMFAVTLPLLDRNALGQIPRLVDLAAAVPRDIVGEQL